jgi:hypothetical protein
MHAIAQQMMIRALIERHATGSFPHRPGLPVLMIKAATRA